MQPLKQAVKELRENGYILARHGGKHDVYFNKNTRSVDHAEASRFR